MTTQRRALIVRGGWDGHEPVQATDLFIPHLRDHGFEVQVADSPAPYADPELMAATDLIVQCMTMSTIEREQLAGLVAAVEAGTGLAGWHGGIADAYRNSADYLQLIGGQFAHHAAHSGPGERTGEQADNYVPHRITLTPGDHPITAGLERLRPGDRAVLGADRRLQRRAGHDDHGGPAVGRLAPPGHHPGGVDAPVGPGPCLRGDAGPQGRHPGRPERPHDRRKGPAVGGTLRVGIVGAGKISGQYSAMIARLPQLTVTAVADLDQSRAQAAGRGAPRRPGGNPAGAVCGGRRDVVLNLTTPAGHAPIAHAAIAAGKHVYGEKPLATSTADGQTIVDAAARAGVRAACAPDTVLGTGVQTARAALESGAIGTAHAATAFMTAAGHERWHPDPEFYYQPGGGPLLDMGPYYLTSLVHLLGPIRRVVAMSSALPIRTHDRLGPARRHNLPGRGGHALTGVLEHTNGALTTMIMTFDVWAAQLPRIEVYGSAGSLSVPDPNYFAGDVKVFPAGGPSGRLSRPARGMRRRAGEWGCSSWRSRWPRGDRTGRVRRSPCTCST